MRLRLPLNLFSVPLYIYIFIIYITSLSVLELHLGRTRTLPLPATVAAAIGLLPLSLIVIFRDLIIRRGQTLSTLITRNLSVITCFLGVMLTSLLFSFHPTAYWGDNSKWIFLISYSFLIFLLAFFAAELAAVQKSFRIVVLLSLILLSGSIIYELSYPGTFSKELGRPSGFPGNSNFAALVLVMLCSSALGYKNKRWQVSDLFILIAGAIGIFGTMSRSGTLNFIVLLALYSWTRFRLGGVTLKKVIYTALTVVLSVFVFSTTAAYLIANTQVFKGKTRFSNLEGGGQIDDGSSDSRFAAVQDSIRLINESPVFGHGTGFSRTMAELPHNLYLQQWVNNGVLGVLCFVLMLGVAFRVFQKRDFMPGKAFIIVTALGSLVSHNVLDQRPFAILFGSLLAFSTLQKKTSPDT